MSVSMAVTRGRLATQPALSATSRSSAASTDADVVQIGSVTVERISPVRCRRS